MVSSRRHRYMRTMDNVGGGMSSWAQWGSAKICANDATFRKKEKKSAMRDRSSGTRVETW